MSSTNPKIEALIKESLEIIEKIQETQRTLYKILESELSDFQINKTGGKKHTNTSKKSGQSKKKK